MAELCRAPTVKEGLGQEKPSTGMRPKKSPTVCSVIFSTLWGVGTLSQNRYCKVQTQKHRTLTKGTSDLNVEFIL